MNTLYSKPNNCLRKHFSLSIIYIVTILINNHQLVFAQGIPFNKKNTIACHNCYETQYATNVEDVFPYTTSIELDIWDSEIYSGFLGSIFGSRMERDWFVKHEPLQKGNLNCCGGTFRNCLERINKWSDTNPRHEIVTIFIDKKENWSDDNETRKPNDLDNLLLSIFGEEKIFRPSKLLNSNNNLKEASSKGCWLTLDSLKGKFIFVITNGTEITDRNPLNEYLTSQKSKAVCFVAPEIKNENEIVSTRGFSQENEANICFYNLRYSYRYLSEKINSINCLSRVYGLPSPETIETFQELVKLKVNFIVLDNYKLKP